MSRHCPEYFIQIISPWIGTAVSPFLWMWRLRPSCVTVASRIHMPAESGGAPLAVSSRMQGSQMPHSAAELAPWGCQLWPQDGGILPHESPPTHIHTHMQGSEVTSGWS